jgi:hypothetical protein
MDPAVTEALLLQRWPHIEAVVRDHGGDPATDLSRDGLIIHVQAWSKPVPLPENPSALQRDLYRFRLDYHGYDEMAPIVQLCDPKPPHRIGGPFEFYPVIEGNGVFGHGTFFCMPGDRRCTDSGNHQDWKRVEYYHPEFVVGEVLGLIQSPKYRGRRAA